MLPAPAPRPKDAPVARLHARLVVHHELRAVDGAAQLRLQHHALARDAVEIGIEQRMLPAPRPWRRTGRCRRSASARRARGRAAAAPARCRRSRPGPARRHARRAAQPPAPGSSPGGGGFVGAGQQHDELVAAGRHHGTPAGTQTCQALAGGAQQLVAGSVAHGVVDVLEAVGSWTQRHPAATQPTEQRVEPHLQAVWRLVRPVRLSCTARCTSRARMHPPRHGEPVADLARQLQRLLGERRLQAGAGATWRPSLAQRQQRSHRRAVQAGIAQAGRQRAAGRLAAFGGDAASSAMAAKRASRPRQLRTVVEHQARGLDPARRQRGSAGPPRHRRAHATMAQALVLPRRCALQQWPTTRSKGRASQDVAVDRRQPGERVELRLDARSHVVEEASAVADLVAADLTRAARAPPPAGGASPQ